MAPIQRLGLFFGGIDDILVSLLKQEQAFFFFSDDAADDGYRWVIGQAVGVRQVTAVGFQQGRLEDGYQGCQQLDAAG